MTETDTIFALATAPGRAAIAVLRISGRAAKAALAALCGCVPPPRRATLVRCRAPESGETIDHGLALFFPAPHSVTGEDVAELQVHGGRAVLAALIAALGALPGLRPAEAGEFTRRAFLNGKLDLTAVEGLADLIAAETAAQRRQAQRQLAGVLERLCEDWRRRLLAVQARCEAAIDFPEEDLPPDLWPAARAEAAAVAGEIAAHLADGGRGERLRTGVSVAILGPPNVGKSSLMNALAGREVAITAATAGTTRDVIEVALDLAGYPVVLADTAGLRVAADAIEAEGMRRARARAAAADLKLILVEAAHPEASSPALAGLGAEDALFVANKVDLLPAGTAPPAGMIPLSLRTGAGLAALLDRLTEAVAARLASDSAPLVTRARHRAALAACRAGLAGFAAASLPELAAEELRQAVRALGRLTGRVDVEDMLDHLFGELCIGK